MTESTVDQAAPAPITPRQRTVFVVTALGAFMASLDLSIVNVAFPALEHSFPHDSRATLAWVITGYGIVFGALLVTAGRTADRLGSRRVFFAGLAVFCTGSALCALAPSVPLLVAGRVVQGVGAAALLPSSLGLLLGAYPQDRRSQVVALWGGVGALAVATGPSFGAALVAAGGWRWVFLVNVPIGAAAWLVGRTVLTPSRPAASGATPDYLGVVLISMALAPLVLGISEGPTWGWSSAAVVGSFAGAGAVGLTFLRRSSRHHEPVLDLTLFRSRSFSVANAATFLYAMGFFAMLLGNILFLTSVWHYSILKAGLAVTPGPLVVAVVSGPAGRLAGRVGFRRVLLGGFVVFVAGLSWYATRVGLHPDYLGVWLPGHPDHRARDRAHLPGAECGGGLEPPRRALRGGQCGQPDRPSGGGRLRRGPAGGHPRRPGRGRGRPGQLPPPVVVLRRDRRRWPACCAPCCAPGRPAGALGAETQGALDRPAAAPADRPSRQPDPRPEESAIQGDGRRSVEQGRSGLR